MFLRYVSVMQNSSTAPKIAVIIPCYNCAKLVPGVLKTLPDSIDAIYVIDDACPQGSGKAVAKVKDKRLKILTHKGNQGVGAAVLTGYRQALQDGADIIVKMDGDGQMDPAQLTHLIAPLLTDAADYAKGNRFIDTQALRDMPSHRLFLNALLSFCVKLATGYWGMLDPVNGFTAIRREALERLDMTRIAPRYFFETSLLLALSQAHVRVADVPIPARYGEEISQLRIRRHLPDFACRLLLGWLKRLWRQYFLYDFNMGSVYLLLGLPLLMFGIIFGIDAWVVSIQTGLPRTTGTVMLAVLPTIIGLQFLLQAIAIDMARGEKLFTLWRSQA